MSMENSFKELAGGGLDDFAPKPKSEPFLNTGCAAARSQVN